MRNEQVTRFVNGAVFTGVRERPWVEALALRGSRVAAVGSLTDVVEQTPDALEVDLGGRTLLPGLIDAHNHFLATGESLAAVPLQQLRPTSKQQLLDIVREAALNAPAGDEVTLSGLDPAKLGGGPPTRWELDEVAPQHRVVAYHVSGHGVLVNSRVLAEVQLDDFAADPVGGSYSRDDQGRLSGLCMDAAMQRVIPSAVDIGAHGPNFHVSASDAQLASAVDRAQRAFLAAGLTTVCDAQVTAREMSAYLSADAAARLSIRTVCMPLSHQLAQFGDIGVTAPFGGSRLRLGPMKFYADGSLIAHTALCSHPYGPNADENGYLYRDAQEFSDDVLAAYRQGWSVGVHAQGDRAIETALDAIQRADDAHETSDRRPRIEHAGFPTSEQISRMARMGVMAINQPSYLYEMGDQFIADFGERVHVLQPWRDELDAGVRVVISSDSDVASYRPLNTIAAAMNRTTEDGAAIGPEQVLTLNEALLAHTVDAAFAVGWEDEIGSLEPGKRADCTIVDGDLRAVTAAEVRDLQIWSTVVEGNTVHGDLTIESTTAN